MANRGSIWNEEDKTDLLKVNNTTQDYEKYSEEHGRSLWATHIKVVQLCKYNGIEIKGLDNRIIEKVNNKLNEEIEKKEKKRKKENEKDELISYLMEQNRFLMELINKN